MQNSKVQIYKIQNKKFSNRENIDLLYKQLTANRQLPVESISIHTADGFTVINIKDILYCQARSNYTMIHINGKKDILIGKLQERYGYAKEDAQARYDQWLKSQNAELEHSHRS